MISLQTHQAGPAPESLSHRRVWAFVYCLSVITFLCMVAGFYKYPYGFTEFGGFGHAINGRVLDGTSYYIYTSGGETDGQYHAAIALDPLLRHPEIEAGVDNVFYRSRRILFSWTAWLLGFGRPAWILQVYCLQNVVCWLVLAWLLLRWFPPRDFDSYLRWSGVLFSCGMLFSVRGAFVDGPALLLLALAMKYIEERRIVPAGILLALAGLARETSVLAIVTIFDPARRGLGDFGRFVIRAALIVAPLACWIAYLSMHVVHARGACGFGNFDLPFVELFRWGRRLLGILAGGHLRVWKPMLLLVSMVAQAAYFLARPQWKNPWWRLGAVFVVMMVFLGRAVWEPGGGDAARALLPMLLAFNVLVPRGGRSMLLLAVGNLSLVYMPLLLAIPH